jgi:hypothetical protein
VGPAGDELLAEGAVFEDDAEGGEALVEDLAAVGDGKKFLIVGSNQYYRVTPFDEKKWDHHGVVVYKVRDLSSRFTGETYAIKQRRGHRAPVDCQSIDRPGS